MVRLTEDCIKLVRDLCLQTDDFMPTEVQIRIRERVVRDLENFVRQIYPGLRPELPALFYSVFLCVPISHFLDLEYLPGSMTKKKKNWWGGGGGCVAYMTSVTKYFVCINTTSHDIFHKGFSGCQYITWHCWQCFLSVSTSGDICDKVFSFFLCVSSTSWHLCF